MVEKIEKVWPLSGRYPALSEFKRNCWRSKVTEVMAERFVYEDGMLVEMRILLPSTLWHGSRTMARIIRWCRSLLCFQQNLAESPRELLCHFLFFLHSCSHFHISLMPILRHAFADERNLDSCGSRSNSVNFVFNHSKTKTKRGNLSSLLSTYINSINMDIKRKKICISVYQTKILVYFS